jgi:hypothetical protein
MLPPKVSRSTMAAQRRGSVKVLVQPPKDSLEAIATLLFSSPSSAADSRSWAAFAWLGQLWCQMLVAAFLAVMFTQTGFIGHDADRSALLGERFRRAHHANAVPLEAVLDRGSGRGCHQGVPNSQFGAPRLQAATDRRRGVSCLLDGGR